MTAIAGVGILTADRPALLERALTSYLESSRRHGRQVEFVVFDDSKEAAGRRASLEITRRLGQTSGVAVRFCGHAERRAFVTRLAEVSRLPPEVLAYALLLESGYTVGQNRNALLLDSAGELFFCADDDTVCRMAPPPAPDAALGLSAGTDPADFWCFPSFDAACAAAGFVDRDLLATHETLLGNAVTELLPAGAHAPRGGNVQDVALARLRRGVVAVTVNGLLGDCAWGTPFGLWHVPMGYLAFQGPSLDRLTASDEQYRQTMCSRQVLRITPSPVLADASFSMLTFWGLDNRELLPPHVPVNRGQDLVFGQVLSTCCLAAVFGHVPLALVHDPVPPRRFWNGEVIRSAAGVDLCRVLTEAIALCEFPHEEGAAAGRLRALGGHLARLADLPGRALGELLTERLRSVNRRFERELAERAAQDSRATSQYAADIGRFFERVRSSEGRRDYWIPLDLRSADGPPGAEMRTRDIVRRFGELLVHWPAIVEAARGLRADGVRVSIPA